MDVKFFLQNIRNRCVTFPLFLLFSIVLVLFERKKKRKEKVRGLYYTTIMMNVTIGII
jgi:hypothetical protein